MEITKQMLRDNFIDLGVKKGDTLLIHSSFKSLGEVEEGGEGLFEVLLDLLGEKGTLLFPTLTYSPCFETHVFSYHDTPACTGYLAEKSRFVEGAVRSLHPTHSCVAIGKEKYFLTEGHERDVTPVGANSPFRKLPLIGGKILMLGCGLRPMTSMHGVEETIEGSPFIQDNKTEYFLTDKSGKELIMRVRNHAFRQRFLQRYDRLEHVLDKDDRKTGMIGLAESHLINASNLWKKAHDVMLDDPYYFVEKFK